MKDRWRKYALSVTAGINPNREYVGGACVQSHERYTLLRALKMAMDHIEKLEAKGDNG